MSRAKKQNPKLLSANVLSICDGHWEWFGRSDTTMMPYGITGKYLFFSLNRDMLVEIAIDEIENGGFHHAKTNMAGINPPSGDYVLCLYYKDDSRKHELAIKYRGRVGLKYRYWKSDSETLAGKYSRTFLNKLSSNDKKIFQVKRGEQSD